MSTIKLNNFFSSIKLFFKNFFSSENLNKEIFRYKFNWISVLLFVGIIHYCFLYSVCFIKFIPILLFLVLLPRFKTYNDQIFITVREALLVIFIFLFTTILYWDLLNISPGPDGVEFENRYISILILIFNFFFKKYIENSTYLQAFQVKYFLQFCNILFFITIFIILLVYNKLNTKFKKLYFLTIGIFFFIIAKSLNLKYGSSINDLKLLPFFIFGNFSISLFFMRLSYIFSLSLMLIFLMRIIYNHISNNIIALLISLLIASHPVVCNRGAIEMMPAFWTFIIFLYSVFKIGVFSKENKINYYQIFAIISIFQLARPLMFIAYIPFGLLMTYEYYLENNKKISVNICKKFFLNHTLKLIPMVLIAVPSIYLSLFKGATYSNALNEHTLFGIAPDVLSRVKAYFAKGMMQRAVLFFHPLYLILPFYIFFALKKTFNKVILCLFFFILWAMFILAAPVFWGQPQHFMEYILPFSFFGLFLLIKDLYSKNYKKISYIILSSLLIINIDNIINVNKPNSLLKNTIFRPKNYELHMPSEQYMKYLTYIKENNLLQNSYLNYTLYGYALFIVNGIKYNDYKIFLESQNKFCSINENRGCLFTYSYDLFYEMLLKSNDIKIIAVTQYYLGDAFGTRESFIKKMENSGWAINKDLTNNEFLVMERK